jgi:hypothetical protein
LSSKGLDLKLPTVSLEELALAIAKVQTLAGQSFQPFLPTATLPV